MKFRPCETGSADVPLVRAPFVLKMVQLSAETQLVEDDRVLVGVRVAILLRLAYITQEGQS